MLDNPDNEGIVLPNFHTAFLCHGATILADLRQVKMSSSSLTEVRAFLANFPVSGLVEHLDQSIQRLGNLLQSPFPGINLFPVHINVQQQREHLIDKRIADIVRELEPALFQKLLDANEYDDT